MHAKSLHNLSSIVVMPSCCYTFKLEASKAFLRMFNVFCAICYLGSLHLQMVSHTILMLGLPQHYHSFLELSAHFLSHLLKALRAVS